MLAKVLDFAKQSDEHRSIVAVLVTVLAFAWFFVSIIVGRALGNVDLGIVIGGAPMLIAPVALLIWAFFSMTFTFRN